MTLVFSWGRFRLARGSGGADTVTTLFETNDIFLSHISIFFDFFGKICHSGDREENRSFPETFGAPISTASTARTFEL